MTIISSCQHPCCVFWAAGQKQRWGFFFLVLAAGPPPLFAPFPMLPPHKTPCSSAARLPGDNTERQCEWEMSNQRVGEPTKKLLMLFTVKINAAHSCCLDHLRTNSDFTQLPLLWLTVMFSYTSSWCLISSFLLSSCCFWYSCQLSRTQRYVWIFSKRSLCWTSSVCESISTGTSFWDLQAHKRTRYGVYMQYTPQSTVISLCDCYETTMLTQIK